MQGGSTAVLAILAILVFGALFFVMFGMQGGNQGIGTLQYKNDLITVEDYTISNPKPYPGSSVTIKFTLRNNGPEDIENVKVDFFDTSGLGKSVTCVKRGKESTSCDSITIESLDFVSVSAIINIPEESKIPTLREGKADVRKIRFKISYPVKGQREILIPLTPDRYKEPSMKYEISVPSYGPIQINIQPPMGGITVVDGKEVIRYYGVAGEQVSIKFSFSNVGTVGRTLDPLEIKEVDISYPSNLLTLQGCYPLGNKKDGKIIIRGDGNKRALTGLDFECIFKVNNIKEEKIAKLAFSYTYNYEM
ncbi:MAG: hypothetical protein J7L39_01185, partial [Candidatus Aenigmarchaeota archaeon]|nr:hypothetical protein [Candidatus Aenigmarchaeota archaeon]